MKSTITRESLYSVLSFGGFFFGGDFLFWWVFGWVGGFIWGFCLFVSLFFGVFFASSGSPPPVGRKLADGAGYTCDIWSYRGSQCGCCQSAFTTRSENRHSALYFRFLLLLLPWERGRAVESGVMAPKK